MPINRGTAIPAWSCFFDTSGEQISAPVEAKYSLQSTGDAYKQWDCVLGLELLPQHKQKSEKARVDGASFRKIDHDLLLRSHGYFEVGNNFVHVAADGKSGETQGNKVTSIGLLDDQIMCAAFVSSLQQTRADRKRQNAGQE
jgi:hypothetical protein